MVYVINGHFVIENWKLPKEDFYETAVGLE